MATAKPTVSMPWETSAAIIAVRHFLLEYERAHARNDLTGASRALASAGLKIDAAQYALWDEIRAKEKPLPVPD